MSTCKFCDLLAQPDIGAVLPNLILQTDTAVAVLNRRPAAPGHVTIILTTHHRHTGEMVDDHLAGVGGLLGRLSGALEMIHSPYRVVLLGDGKRSAHLHLHLIPEPAGAALELGAVVADLNLTARAATLSDEETAAAVRSLREALSA
jgi:diadenosine tetraphosphate (Ap4A) HIT family hydrolase